MQQCKHHLVIEQWFSAADRETRAFKLGRISDNPVESTIAFDELRCVTALAVQMELPEILKHQAVHASWVRFAV